MLSYDGINLKTVAYIGAVGVVLTAVSILTATVIYYGFYNQLTSGPMYAVSTARIEKLNAQQQQKLDEYRVVDPERGIVAIPITVAMQRVVDEVSRDPAAAQPAAETPAAETPAAETPATETSRENGQTDGVDRGGGGS